MPRGTLLIPALAKEITVSVANGTNMTHTFVAVKAGNIIELLGYTMTIQSVGAANRVLTVQHQDSAGSPISETLFTLTQITTKTIIYQAFTKGFKGLIVDDVTDALESREIKPNTFFNDGDKIVSVLANIQSGDVTTNVKIYTREWTPGGTPAT